MSICIYKNKCNPAASAANMHYITRDSAADSISFHNLDQLRDDDRIQAKSNAINYAAERELEEEARIIGNERGTPRNHNRMIFSFDRKEETETAREEAHKFLDKNFQNQRAVVSVHQDQDKTHVHIWFDCRDIETDRKTQIQPRDFYTLDEKWAAQYDRKYGTEYEREYTTKKRETFEWKREEYERTQGADGKKELPENKPERHRDHKTRILRDKEIRNHGLEKSADREDKRLVTAGRSGIDEGKRTLAERAGRGDDADRAADNADKHFDAAIREAKDSAERISRTIEQLHEREFRNRNLGRDRDRDYDYGR